MPGFLPSFGLARRVAPFLLLTALWPGQPAAAQHSTDTTAAETFERALEDAGTDAGEALAELLGDLAADPLDVNAATADELAQLPHISPALARAIVHNRDEEGSFGSLPELHRVAGVNAGLYLAARPYLTIGETMTRRAAASTYLGLANPRSLLNDMQVDVLQRMERRLDVGRGYSDDTTRTTYLGSPVKLYTRLQLRSGRHFRAGLVLEKDPGERFTWDAPNGSYGFDHVAGHLSVAGAGRLKMLVLGDYIVNAGQGLVLWRPGAFGKGRATVGPLVRSGTGVRPFASSTENTFFRGAAAVLSVTPDITATAFVSRRHLDATVVEVDTSGGASAMRAATTLLESGLHRTPTELAKKNALRETLGGGALDWQHGRLSAGATGYVARFDTPIKRGDRPYERHQFAGNRTSAVSLFGRTHIGPAYLFGEVARGHGGAWAGVGGALVEVGRSFEAVLMTRHYPRNFHSLHGYAFGERNGATNNETGVYLGLALQPSPTWTVAAYVDQYRFPYLRYNIARPTSGYDTRLVVEHRPRRWLTWYAQLRNETRDEATETPAPERGVLAAVHPETRQSLRLQVDYTFSEAMRVRARAEGVRWQGDSNTQYGTVLYQQLQWEPTEHVRLYTRLTFFDTDGWDSRVYTYENDLLYTFSVPVFSGQGQRAFLLVRLAPMSRLTIELKGGVTHYEHVDKVGSGLDEVPGRRLREVRAQLRWRL